MNGGGMRNNSGLLLKMVVCLMMYLAMTAPAYAYLDPGTGSLILQIVLGGVAGLLVGWKFFWHRIKEVLKIGGKPEEG